MKLYIVRHGETKWNREHILQGQLDSPLTEKGTGGARKIKEALKNIEFKAVYTSQQKRAIETTELILEDRKIGYKIEGNIKEMSYGNWQGKSQAQICKDPESAKMYLNYFKHPESYVPVSGGEGFREVIKRAEMFLTEIRERHEADDILLAVTHGTFIKALFAAVKKRSVEDFWDEPHITNCSISILEISENGFHIIVEADDSHLGDDAVKITEADYLK